MKAVYIFVIVVLIVGTFYVLVGPPNRVADTADPDPRVAATEEDAVQQEDQGAVDAPEPEPELDTATIDAEREAEVVMEYPIPDESIELETRRFAIDSFNYGYDITEIRVSEGETVTIDLTASEGYHDWVIDEFGVATDRIRAGGFATVTFVADQAGTFEYYCSVGDHRERGMVGTLIVE